MTGLVGRELERTGQVVLHLTAREFRIRYATSSLGWLWAVVPPFARLLVLGVIFTQVLPVQADDYVADLAVGLLGWAWFANGVASATRSPADRRDLLAQPDLPRQTLPVVSVLTDGLDYLAALPLLLVVTVVVTGALPPTVLLLPVLLVLQGLLTLGVGMAAAALDVRFRDSRLGVDLALAVGFYATPVLFSLEAVPPGVLGDVLAYNPVGRLLEAQRDVLVDGVVPDLSSLAALALLCCAAAVAGWTVYRRTSGTFLDHL